MFIFDVLESIERLAAFGRRVSLIFECLQFLFAFGFSLVAVIKNGHQSLVSIFDNGRFAAEGSKFPNARNRTTAAATRRSRRPRRRDLVSS